MKIPKDWQKPIANGRLLILSPFAVEADRQSAHLAADRNHFISRIADQLLIVHASRGSQTERLVAQLRNSNYEASRKLEDFTVGSKAHYQAL